MVPETSRPKVLLGMSGGVDSSVAVHILKERGFDVTGLMLVTGSVSPDSVERARSAASRFGITLIIKDMSDEFDQLVVNPFIAAYAAGLTPNPCVMCNPRFKFRCLKETADACGIDRIATGHFAKMVHTGAGAFVAMGASPKNDQSYFLYALPAEIRRRTVFPLGDMGKDRVKELAEQLGLGFSGVRSSQEACFLKGGLKEWLSERMPGMLVPGPAYDIATGGFVGTHSGSLGLTLGQRKGHGVARGERAYIAGIDHSLNAIYLGDKEDCLVSEVTAGKPVLGKATMRELEGGMELTVRTRSSMVPVKAEVRVEEGMLLARTHEPVWAPASGQSLVCYDEDTIACGSVISEQKSPPCGGPYITR